jgi:hypothetical protein
MANHVHLSKKHVHVSLNHARVLIALSVSGNPAACAVQVVVALANSYASEAY